MGLVTEEQKEKRPSQFIKLEDKSKVTLFSNLYKIKTHFLQGNNTSVLCAGEGCFYCDQGVKARMEHYYYGLVENGKESEEGIVRVPASVFFALNDQERVLEIDKRDSVWVISKKGSGLDTEYGVARGKEAGKPPVSIEEANKKLITVLDNHVKNMKERYLELSKQSDFDMPEEEDISEAKYTGEK